MRVRVSGVCCAHELHICIPLCGSLLQCGFWGCEGCCGRNNSAAASLRPSTRCLVLWCGLYIPKTEKRRAIFVARLPALARVCPARTRGVLSCVRPTGFFDRAVCALLITFSRLAGLPCVGAPGCSPSCPRQSMLRHAVLCAGGLLSGARACQAWVAVCNGS